MSSVPPFARLSPSELGVSAGYRGASHPLPVLFLPANPKNPVKCRVKVSVWTYVSTCVFRELLARRGSWGHPWSSLPTSLVQPPSATLGHPGQRVAESGAAWALPAPAHPPRSQPGRAGIRQIMLLVRTRDCCKWEARLRGWGSSSDFSWDEN